MKCDTGIYISIAKYNILKDRASHVNKFLGNGY